MSQNELYTRITLIISLSFSEMITVSMRITWIFQSAFLVWEFLAYLWRILWRSRLHYLLVAFHPKGPLGRLPFLFFLNPSKSKCEIFLSFNIIYTILLFREEASPPKICSLSFMTQTESGLPPLPNKSSSLLSSFVR